MTGVALPVEVEMLRRRITVLVPAALARTLEPRDRFKTANYRKRVDSLCINVPLRKAWETFNDLTLRTERGYMVPFQTFVWDFRRDGQVVRKGKQSLAVTILVGNTINPETLKRVKGEWPAEWTVMKVVLVTITGNEPLPISSLIHDWDPGNPGLPVPDIVLFEESQLSQEKEKEALEQVYSEPDTDPFLPRRKRRKTRVEASAEDMEGICNGYVDWLNRQQKHDECKILYAWIVEKGSEFCVYIAIDAVYVNEQSASHVNGGKSELKTKKTRVVHWNVCVEFDNLRYLLTASTLKEVFQQLMAFLIVNGLMDRYFVFFADGEAVIFEYVETYFGWHAYTCILDWFHITEKVFQRLSSAIKAVRVDDPRSPVEFYKQGEKAGQEKQRKQTSLSVLYARRACSILWVGNVEEAKSYLRRIDPSVIKNQEAIDKLIEYLDNKKEWIVCYALRKRAGLRNSSNGSEGGNDILVADRQKDDDMSWREEGSTSAASLACLFANGEQNAWYSTGELTYKVPDEKRNAARQPKEKEKKEKSNCGS